MTIGPINNSPQPGLSAPQNNSTIEQSEKTSFFAKIGILIKLVWESFTSIFRHTDTTNLAAQRGGSTEHSVEILPNKDTPQAPVSVSVFEEEKDEKPSVASPSSTPTIPVDTEGKPGTESKVSEQPEVTAGASVPSSIPTDDDSSASPESLSPQPSVPAPESPKPNTAPEATSGTPIPPPPPTITPPPVPNVAVPTTNADFHSEIAGAKLNSTSQPEKSVDPRDAVLSEIRSRKDLKHISEERGATTPTTKLPEATSGAPVPPPPPAPATPPPPAPDAPQSEDSSKGSGMSQDLLSAIRQGKKLNKTPSPDQKSEANSDPNSPRAKLEAIRNAVAGPEQEGDEDDHDEEWENEYGHPGSLDSKSEAKSTPEQTPAMQPGNEGKPNIGAGTPPPPPPPSPVQRSQSAPIPGKGQGGDLLAQIRAGKQLNHVNKETSDEASQAKGRGGGSLADVLGNSPVLKKFGNPESKTNTIDPSNDEWED